MFGRTLMTLGLAMLLAAPAHAGFGLVLPDSPIAVSYTHLTLPTTSRV